MTIEEIKAKPGVAIREFFNAGSSRPIPLAEYMGFWKECSEPEKEAFKAEVVKWDGKSFFIN